MTKSKGKQTKKELRVEKVRASTAFDPIPLDIRGRVSALHHGFAAFEMEAALKRRNVFDSSVESAAVRFAKQRKTAGRRVQQSVEAEYFQKLGERINAMIDVVEHLANHRNAELQQLNDAKSQRLIGQGDYSQAAEAFEEQLTHLRLELIGLKRNSGMIRGTAMDRCRQPVAMKDVDASIDMLMDNVARCVKIEPAVLQSRPDVAGCTDPRERQRAGFRQSLIEYYDAEKDKDARECYKTSTTGTD